MNQLNFFDEFERQRLCKPQAAPDFDGDTYDPLADHERLASSLGRVWDLMRDGQWRSLSEISEVVGSSEAGVSARLRDLRKAKMRRVFPTEFVHSERRQGGLWMYQVVVPAKYRKR